jgi:hypothetical protein
MRILLINTNRYKVPFPVMPVGLCWVAASLESAGHDVRFLDLAFSMDSGSEITNAVAEHKPGIVGLSVRNIDTCNGYRPVFLLEKIKKDIIVPLKRSFSGPVVLGGPAAGIN